MSLPFCVGTINYFATGEGVHVAIVIAPTQAAAQQELRKRCGEYLEGGAEYFFGMPGGEHEAFLKYIPDAVVSMARRIPNFLYFSQFDYNLS